MTEESVIVDDETIVTDDESQDDSQNDQVDQATGDEGEEGVEYTEKGTKKDPNPQSAVHQELANARRQIQQMEGLLTNPTALRRYAEQNGMTLAEAKADIKEEQEDQEDLIEEFTPDQFQTSGDVAKALNQIRSTTSKTIREIKAENQRLREGYKGISSSRELERVANNMEKDIATVRTKYPELNPTSPNFDKELEQSIGELYHELDFDQNSQTFRGKVSLARIADNIMKAAGIAKKQGSRQAQTNVVVKQAGKVNSSKGKSNSGITGGLTIAQKIAKAYGN